MIQNPEQHTWASMAHGLGIRPPMDQTDQRTQQTVKRGELWPAGDPAAWTRGAILGYIDAARRGGSENFPLTALACMILLGSPDEKRSAITIATACLQEQKDDRGWMGAEVGSRVYWSMHLIPLLVFYQAPSAGLRDLAHEWLTIFLAWIRYGQASELGVALWLGQRSCEPGLEQPREELEALALGPWPPKHWSLASAMLGALDARGALLSTATLPLPAWKTAVPVHIYRSDAGEVTVIVERSCNNNTPPVLGASTVGGKLQWAPTPPWGLGPDGRIRIRGEKHNPNVETAEVQLGPAAALYRNSKWYKDVALPLPPKPRIHWIVGGPVVREEAEPAAPSPVATPTPAPSPRAKSGCLTLLLALVGVVACWVAVAGAFLL